MLSVYFHWPFCAKKCPYCDYNTHVRATVDYQAWAAAYKAAIKALHHKTGLQQISSIFFGGGTPSLMPAWLIEDILHNLSRHFSLTKNIEITLEANPTYTEAQHFKDFKAAGINRVSVGVQALDDEHLKWLGRQHTKTEALKTLNAAAQHFDRWSTDLMYGRPNLTAKDWAQEVNTVLQLGAQHLSCYQLTVMEETALFRYYKRGDFTLPDDDEVLAMEAATKQLAAHHNLEHYEISSYGAAGHHCRHNEHYWQYNSYAGIGPGAHGRLHKGSDIIATSQQSSPEKWLANPDSFAENTLLPKDKVAEYILLGLRHKNGINETDFLEKTGSSFSTLPLNDLIEEGFLQKNEDAVQATEKGWRYLNYVESVLIA